MDFRLLLTVFTTVFLAEPGDKTQLATLLFATDRQADPWIVFAGAALALVATSALGVLAGTLAGNLISPRLLHLVAGTGFIAIGLWTLLAPS